MGELTLEKFAAIAEVIGMLTIVSGLIFGIFQLRAHRMQQRNIVASGLAKTFYNPEFAKALVLLERAQRTSTRRGPSTNSRPSLSARHSRQWDSWSIGKSRNLTW